MSWALISARIIVKVILMVVFGIPPLLKLFDHGNNVFSFGFIVFLFDLLGHFFGYLTLIVVKVEDCRSILSTTIGTLMIVVGGVVGQTQPIPSRILWRDRSQV